MTQIKEVKNSLKLEWNGKPQEIIFKPSKLKLEEFLSSKNVGDSEQLKSNKWTNLLVKGNNINVIPSLLEHPYKSIIEKFGGLKLAYIDPPFFTGQNRLINKSISKNKQTTKDGEIAYEDKWNNSIENYLSTLYTQLFLINKILRDGGYIYVHVDYRTSSAIKLILDEIFGTENLIGYIIWVLNNGAKGRKNWSNQHNDILCYSKGKNLGINFESPLLRKPFSKTSLKTHFTKKDNEGRNYRIREINGKEYKYYADEGKVIGSVWDDCTSMNANSPIMKESTGYPTQKPLKLLKRIISASTDPGDIVGDFFCGSGTTLHAAQSLGRKWIGVDNSEKSLEITKQRIQSIEKTCPMEEPSCLLKEIKD